MSVREQLPIENPQRSIEMQEYASVINRILTHGIKRLASDNDDSYVIVNEDNTLDIYTNNTFRLRINSDGNIGISTTNIPFYSIDSGIKCLTVIGSTKSGAFELATNEADANDVNVGIIYGTDKNSVSSDKRIAQMRFTLTGSSANNRGGKIIFGVKSDGSSGLNAKLEINPSGLLNKDTGTTSAAYCGWSASSGEGYMRRYSSSERYKQDIKEKIYDIEDLKQKLFSLKIKEYRNVDDVKNGFEDYVVGITAEDMAPVFPEMVIWSEDEKGVKLPECTRFLEFPVLYIPILMDFEYRISALEDKIK